MSSFIIKGQQQLAGTIRVSGAKNDALKLMAATLLTSEECVLTNVPEITDVRIMAELLEKLGAKVTHPKPDTYRINCAAVNSTVLDPKLAEKLRASIILVAPLLARFGEVTVSHPGGCIIGKRPIDMFLDSYRALGATIDLTDEAYHIRAQKLRGHKIVLPWVSHTVTDSILMAASLAEGTTTIVNAAMEPEVVNLAKFLKQGGVNISGAGTAHITIEGAETVSGSDIRVIPDRLEAGTFTILGALAAKHLTITDAEPAYLETFFDTLQRIGVKYSLTGSVIEVSGGAELKGREIRTHEHPGLATDLQPPLTVLLTQASGMSLVHDIIYEGRLFYTGLLNKMGANIIMADPHRVVVEGPTPLYGGSFDSPDIRAGMALVIAGMIATGKTTLNNIDLIDRGYERLDERLQAVGAKIKRQTSK